MSPRSTNGARKLATGVAYTRSQCNSSVTPIPTARPSTAAIIGLVTLGSRWMNICEGAACCEPSCARRAKSLMSLPAVNTPPDPMKTCAAMASLLSAPSSAADIASYIGPESAFFFSARTRRMICTPSYTAISISLVIGIPHCGLALLSTWPMLHPGPSRGPDAIPRRRRPLHQSGRDADRADTTRVSLSASSLGQHPSPGPTRAMLIGGPTGAPPFSAPTSWEPQRSRRRDGLAPPEPRAWPAQASHQARLPQGARPKRGPTASSTSHLDMDGTLGNGQGRLLHRLGQRWMGVASAGKVFG